MSVKLRMKRMGTKKRPFYRVVAIDSRMARDGRFIDIVGFYNPMVHPPEIKMDDDKVYHWLRNGALPSEKVRELFRRIGLMEKWSLVKKGVSIADLDAKVEERRAKQPRPAADKEKRKRPNKKAAARAAAEKAGAKVEESA